MSLKIYKNTKVFIISPVSSITGGIESLHQLGYNLRNRLGIETYIYYYPDISLKVEQEETRYNVPYIQKIADEHSNILIIPEIFTNLDTINNFKNIRKVVWWLSIDNYFLSLLSLKHGFLLQRGINKISNFLFKKPVYNLPIILQNDIYKLSDFLKKDKVVQEASLHLVQSEYAKNYLLKSDIREDILYYLSDYINESFLNRPFNLEEKKDFVVYNHRKGYFFTRHIMQHSSGIKFIPLLNMDRAQVITTLSEAKVYIDFGTHPGKDKPPREAAIMGCCVITGKRGSAAYFEDVPIPEKYKFEDKKENIPKIIERIRDCLENYNERYKDFDNYREIIRKEPEKFVEDMKKIFVKVL